MTDACIARCPLCREPLPAGPEKAYDDGVRGYARLQSVFSRQATPAQAQGAEAAPEEAALAASAPPSLDLAAAAASDDAPPPPPPDSTPPPLATAPPSSWSSLSDVHKAELREIRRVLEEASEGGHQAAAGVLGEMYFFGHGVDVDWGMAFNLYKLSADRGSATACQNVGVSYRDGEGVEANDVKAVAYFRLAADLGAADGLDCLGYMYESGRGVDGPDLQMAMELYAKAARQGDGLGQFHYGLLLREIGGKVQVAQARIMVTTSTSQR
mmetsp:Transcript_33300/g.88096  ORF Transcript_33300/g.88096 Transcript_33300/m.88096 type:complete len:269 (-) Transcript_33300:574-1380(-)